MKIERKKWGLITDDEPETRVKLPAHINRSLTQYQNNQEIQRGKRPSKADVIIQALAEFFATRVAPVAILAVLTSCQVQHLDSGIFVLKILFVGALLVHIYYICRGNHGEKH